MNSLHVRLAATKALYNSLEFTKSNFDKEVLIFIIIYSSVPVKIFRLKGILSCK